MRYYFSSRTSPATESAYRLLGRRNDLISSIESFLPERSFSSEREYREVMKRLISVVRNQKQTSKGSPLHSTEIAPIRRGKPLTERTHWGGVSMKEVDVENDYIRKLLVVNRLGVLGFEYHRMKQENLRVLEGSCLVVYSNHNAPEWKRGRLSWKIAAPGDRFQFLPYDEHGILALTNCVIEETSTNHLDDLVFVYKMD
jgi:hypothetical protein